MIWVRKGTLTCFEHTELQRLGRHSGFLSDLPYIGGYAAGISVGKHGQPCRFGSLQHKIKVGTINMSLREKPQQRKEERGGGSGRIVSSWWKAQKLSRKRKLIRQQDKEALGFANQEVTNNPGKNIFSRVVVQIALKNRLCFVQPPPCFGFNPKKEKELNLQSALLNYISMDCSCDSKNLLDKTTFSV